MICGVKNRRNGHKKTHGGLKVQPKQYVGQGSLREYCSDNKPESDLSCGWDEQTEAVYGNIDSDTHACKSQVTLPHDCLQRFVRGLKESNKLHV